MRNLFRTLVSSVIGVAVLTGALPTRAAGFMDDFESGLGKWTGKDGGAHHGIIVTDPLASGRGGVLSFSDFGSGGDIFSLNQISISGSFELSFDYLGLPASGSVPGNLGGFLGIAYSLHPVAEGTDVIWYAGTIDSYPGLLIPLADDGVWHHYSVTLDGTALGAFRLTLEDYVGSGGNCDDSYFDNITLTSVTPVPEPSVAATTLLGLLLAFVAVRRWK